MDKINVNDILQALSGNIKKLLNINIISVCDSTNTQVKKFALNGENEGYVLIAETQTGGRGRMGRTFFSPDSTGIYMSILLRPQITPENVTFITSAAAVAVCKALEKISENKLKPQIKWVNDIFLNNKKVCGILTEGGFKNSSETDYAVLGLGINFYEPENGFPSDISSIAGAVFENQKQGLKSEFISEFLNIFFEFYGNLTSSIIVKEYKKRCFVIGRKILVINGEQTASATALGIDDKFGLEVLFDTEEKQVIRTGEISVKVL